jgi:hypothetical protein
MADFAELIEESEMLVNRTETLPVSGIIRAAAALAQ